MNTTDFLSYLETLVETTDVECKAAQRRDGRGDIPQSVYQTYSAMVNSAGGDIYLGVEETKDHRFDCKGILDIHKVKKAFWDTINSTKKISKNILTDSNLDIVAVSELSILHVHVPQARLVQQGFLTSQGETRSRVYSLNAGFSDTNDLGTTTQEKMSEKMSEKILGQVADQPTITIAELAESIGVTTRTIERNLKILQNLGRLHRIGPAKGGHWEVLEKP
jgi:predicted HTH transcriptional regulator